MTDTLNRDIPPTICLWQSVYYEQVTSCRDTAAYAKAHDIDMTLAHAHAGIFAVLPLVFDRRHQFDFDPDGVQGAVVEAYDEDGETVVDLIAWPLERPQAFATALGQAEALGIGNVTNPATYWHGKPLRVHRTPLAWLKSGCDGCCIINRKSAPRWLGEALGNIATEDLEHGRELARLLHGYFESSRILAPLPRAA